ncbi:UNVERIFIED_CONTAM: hypothetical protein GTU68_017403 [Idotea baltica]|nr:hypothetical protein [Idotea baltica]
MQESAISLAARLIAQGDPDLYEIIVLSLRVSLSSVSLSLIFGLTLGAALATGHFRGRLLLNIIINALMSMPPVVVGLLAYLALSRSGPMGWLGLLYTPTAMIIAQTFLITPLIAALSRQVIEDLYNEYREQFLSLRLTQSQRVKTLLWDARYSLSTVALAGLGRALSEVGAVIIVGGNIEHLTRVMTTAIALETSKGDLALALALGIILLTLALLINVLLASLSISARRQAYA